MNKQLFTYSIILLFSVCSFGQIEGYRQNDSDLYFKFLTKNNPPTAKLGDLVSLQMVMKSSTGEVLKNSYTEGNGKPILFPVKVSVFSGDIYEAVGMMSAGDSASFLIPADSMYKKVFRQPLPKSVIKGSLLEFTIKTKWIKAQDEMKIPARELEVDRSQLAKEEVEMNEYMVAHVLNMTKTKSGVYIQETKKGKGEIATVGKMISFNYIGKFLNDELFESTFEKEQYGRPISITVGNQQVIRGWEEAFLEMRAGGFYTVIVPSHMAFGTKGKAGIIPPNMPLVFEIQVLSVR
jgi:FKBP-type peptidyl-prolyl cis-trans isomerase FkpA